MNSMPSIVVVLVFVAALALGAGCRTVPRAEEPSPPESAPAEAAEAAPDEDFPEPREPDVPVELRGVPVTLEELAEYLAVRDYRFAGRNGVEVSLTLENRTAAEELSLLVATEFLGREDEKLFRTEWVEVDLAPRARHYYSAQTGDRFARTARVLLQVLDWPGEEPAQADSPAPVD